LAITTSGPAPLVEPPPRRSALAGDKRLRSLLGLTAARLAVLGGGLLAWEIVARAGIGPSIYISSPGGVANFLSEALRTSEFWQNLWATVSATLIAFGIAGALGIVAGLGLGLMPKVDAVLDPFLTAINCTPRIALAPLFVLIFGLTQQSKIVLAFSIAFFIVLVSTRGGVKVIDREWLQVMDVYGAKRRQRFTKVFFPVSVPAIMSGLRLGVVYSLLGVITSEFIAAQTGVGQLIVRYSNQFLVDNVYGLIIVLVAIASALNGAVGVLERWLLRWQPRQ
jgi:NitT/TauT family transport system permease protein